MIYFAIDITFESPFLLVFTLSLWQMLSRHQQSLVTSVVSYLKPVKPCPVMLGPTCASWALIGPSKHRQLTSWKRSWNTVNPQAKAQCRAPSGLWMAPRQRKVPPTTAPHLWIILWKRNPCLARAELHNLVRHKHQYESRDSAEAKRSTKVLFSCKVLDFPWRISRRCFVQLQLKLLWFLSRTTTVWFTFKRSLWFEIFFH